jgi:RNA polymerase sigma-70 factor (ECF subfamily)
MANGQPALAIYQLEPDGAHHAHAVLLPTVTRRGIARMVSFVNPDLFGLFGLPLTYRAVELMPAQDPAVSPWAG